MFIINVINPQVRKIIDRIHNDLQLHLFKSVYIDIDNLIQFYSENLTIQLNRRQSYVYFTINDNIKNIVQPSSDVINILINRYQNMYNPIADSELVVGVQWDLEKIRKTGFPLVGKFMDPLNVGKHKLINSYKHILYNKDTVSKKVIVDYKYNTRQCKQTMYTCACKVYNKPNVFYFSVYGLNNVYVLRSTYSHEKNIKKFNTQPNTFTVLSTIGLYIPKQVILQAFSPSLPLDIENYMVFSTVNKELYNINKMILVNKDDNMPFTEKYKDDFYYFPNNTLYAVSKTGQVINTKTQLILKPSKTTNEYLRINSHDIFYQAFGIQLHRLLASLFVKVDSFRIENERTDIVEVNHIDGIKTHNTIDNLEWCTKIVNLLHAVNIGLRSNTKPVKILNVNTGCVSSFPSVNQAAAYTKVKENNIRVYLDLKQDYPMNDQYIVKYQSDESPWPSIVKYRNMETRTMNKATAILAMNLKNKKIESYPSISVAAKAMKDKGIKHRTLALRVQRQKDTQLPYKGYAFKRDDGSPWNIEGREDYRDYGYIVTKGDEVVKLDTLSEVSRHTDIQLSILSTKIRGIVTDIEHNDYRIQKYRKAA
jgi:hypothetical protein